MPCRRRNKRQRRVSGLCKPFKLATLIDLQAVLAANRRRLLDSERLAERVAAGRHVLGHHQQAHAKHGRAQPRWQALPAGDVQRRSADSAAYGLLGVDDQQQPQLQRSRLWTLCI